MYEALTVLSPAGRDAQSALLTEALHTPGNTQLRSNTNVKNVMNNT